MKQSLFIIMMLFSAATLQGQSLEGKWEGYYTYDNPVMPEGLPPLVRTEVRVVSAPATGRVKENSSPRRSLPADRVSYSTEVSPTDMYAHRAKTTKIPFSITCVQNMDGTYDFTSYTQNHHQTIKLKMEYEIIGKDSIYLVEIIEPGSEIHYAPQQMLLHIKWQKKGKKKVLKMQGPWFKLLENKKQGEIVLLHEN